MKKNLEDENHENEKSNGISAFGSNGVKYGRLRQQRGK